MGDRLGRYTLLKRLAVGGMGEVFVAAKAGPMGFGPMVALKVLRDELAVDQQFVDMLVDEANITKHLNHQNLVSVLDLGEHDGNYYIAMEFVQGVTAERLIESLVERQRKLDVPLAIHVGVELCRALRYAHSRTNDSGEPLNIIHRDVTPANILISTEGEVKLTDFGIARAKGRIHQTQAGVLKGKFGYMAPEMVRYEELDGRADLFCAGVLLYLLASGRHPVAHASVMDAIQRYENKQVPPPSSANPEVPPELDQVIMKALEPQPSDRWPSAQEFGAALQAVLLSHPAWRAVTKDAPSLLARRVQEVAPEVFGEVVPRETLARLSAELPEDSLLPSLALPRESAEAGPTETSSPAGVEAEKLDRLPKARAADLDTDEGLPYEDVQRAREALAQNAPEALAFPDTSTDPGSDRADRIAEPELPAPGSAEGYRAPQDNPARSSDRTVAASFDWSEPEIDRTLANDDDEDGATMIGVAVDDLTAVGGSILDEDTLGNGNGEDGPTIIPLRPEGQPQILADEERPTAVGAEADVWGGEGEAGATLLEGLDSAAVREALERLPSAPNSDVTVADDAFGEDDEVPDVPTFVRPTPDLAGPDSDAPSLNGPLRIVLGEDGAPSLASPGRGGGVAGSSAVAGASGVVGPASGAPLPSARGSDPAVVPYGQGLDVGTDTGRWMAGELDSSRLGWGDEEAGRRAVATRNRNQDDGQAPLGTPAARVVGGQAVQPTYGAGSPAGATPSAPGLVNPVLVPSEPPPGGVSVASSFIARNGPLLAVLSLMLLLAGGFGFVWFGTQLLWPTLQIETVPPGARVTVDGQRQLGRTPLSVVVAPGQRHRIELRVDGYAPALREITEGIGRGRTYALEVALDRVPPTLFIGPEPAAVYLNDRRIGTGREVRLVELPSAGQVRIRIEADGFVPYEINFDSAAKIPVSVDVPLERK